MTASTNVNGILNQMMAALRGNFTPRKDEVEGRYDLSDHDPKNNPHKVVCTKPRCDWTVLYGPSQFKGSRYQSLVDFAHSNKEAQGILEAFVLLLESNGLAKVSRIIVQPSTSYIGFLRPEYTPEGVALIQEAASKFFEGCSDKFHKVFVLNSARNLLGPNKLQGFKLNHRQALLAGLGNTKLDKNPEIEVLWANVVLQLVELGFQVNEEDFVKAVWDKSKTIPYGYLEPDYGAQVVLANALLEKAPKELMELEYVRCRLGTWSLTKILATIPVRLENVEMHNWQIDRHYPHHETYKPIVEFLNRVLG